MQAAGVRFESHSYAHRTLPDLTEDECERDLRASRELLEEVLSRPVTLLAYPRGRHDQRVRRAAERAGYVAAFSLPESKERFGPFAVPRIGVHPGNGTRWLRVKTSRWYRGVRTSRVYPALRGALRRDPPLA
jgi:peptidoglycan/xylan/chitin deacetylase (PgdA/CDA1 family)